MTEIWKDIKGYEGLYQVSTKGRVKSLERQIIGKRYSRYTKPERTLKNSVKNNEYLFVQLSKNGKLKHFYVHRLVAIAFIPNPDNLPCVNHKDEDRQNNCVENLEWCTYLYNDHYGTRNAKLSRPIIIIDLKNNNLETEYSGCPEASLAIKCSRSSLNACALGNHHQVLNRYTVIFKDEYTSKKVKEKINTAKKYLVRKNRILVYNDNYSHIFNSLAEAVNILGLTQSAAWECLQHNINPERYNRKIHKGYYFKYVEEG